jgi:hypothetical protein
MHSWAHVPLHDMAFMALFLLLVGTVLAVRILWKIYKVVAGFWSDFRKVNRLDDWEE